MEEFIGGIWDKLITRAAMKRFPEARVELTTLQPMLGTCFRAFGGATSIRIEQADLLRTASLSSVAQRIAGAGTAFYPTTNNQDVLTLPPSIDLFQNKALNEALYYYLVALAAQQHAPFTNWFCDNQQRVLDLWNNVPGYRKRYHKLVEAYLPLRPHPHHLEDEAKAQEEAIQQALLDPGSIRVLPAAYHFPAPVLLWLYPSLKPSQQFARQDSDPGEEQEEGEKPEQTNVKVRKKSERVEDNDNAGGLMLFRLENLFSWTEYSHLDRNVDEEEDEDAASIAQDMEVVSVSSKTAKSSRIKFDLDLPAEAFDETPLGGGILLPEWDYRSNSYHENYCNVQPFFNQDAVPQPLPDHLKGISRKIRAQFEMLQPQRHWERQQMDGEEIDLDSWLNFFTDKSGDAAEQRFYRSFRGKTRDLSCLLLADLSMSTSAHVDEQRKVIDLIKDSVLLFSEALNATQDHFAIYGFSSARRKHVRFNFIKNFNEKHSDIILGRIQALKPGFYTRMGAAIRQANNVLTDQRDRHKILLIVSDGKPNDIDHYEGRYGIEDTRQAVLEARQKGIIPFCITIDKEANDYLPYIFGSNGFVVVATPERLPSVLPQLYAQLTHL